MRVAILLLSIVVAVSAAPKTDQRIVGGSVADISQYPYVVGFLYQQTISYYGQSCGGIIVTAGTIITSARCFGTYTAGQYYRVRVGSSQANSGGVVHNVARAVIHGLYNRTTFDNDMAAVRLQIPITFNNNARAAAFAGSTYNVADNQPVWAVGWGQTWEGGPRSEQLQHVQLAVVNQAVCRTRLSEVGEVITDNMLCAGALDVGGRDACSGDQGGPLVHNGVVVGLVSFGYGCGNARYPRVTTRISRYTDWITYYG